MNIVPRQKERSRAAGASPARAANGNAERPKAAVAARPLVQIAVPRVRNPMRLKRTLDEEMTPPFRRHDCRSYRDCLDQACTDRWESWCCTGCYAFEAAERPETSTNRGRDFF